MRLRTACLRYACSAPTRRGWKSSILLNVWISVSWTRSSVSARPRAQPGSRPRAQRCSGLRAAGTAARVPRGHPRAPGRAVVGRLRVRATRGLGVSWRLSDAVLRHTDASCGVPALYLSARTAGALPCPLRRRRPAGQQRAELCTAMAFTPPQSRYLSTSRRADPNGTVPTPPNLLARLPDKWPPVRSRPGASLTQYGDPPDCPWRCNARFDAASRGPRPAAGVGARTASALGLRRSRPRGRGSDHGSRSRPFHVRPGGSVRKWCGHSRRRLLPAGDEYRHRQVSNQTRGVRSEHRPSRGRDAPFRSPVGTRVHVMGPHGRAVVDWESGNVIEVECCDAPDVYFTPDGSVRFHVSAAQSGTRVAAFAEPAGTMLWERAATGYPNCDPAAVGATYLALHCWDWDFPAIFLWHVSTGAERQLMSFLRVAGLAWHGHRLLVSHELLPTMQLVAYDPQLQVSTVLAERPWPVRSAAGTVMVSPDEQHAYWQTWHETSPGGESTTLLRPGRSGIRPLDCNWESGRYLLRLRHQPGGLVRLGRSRRGRRTRRRGSSARTGCSPV